MLAQTFFDFDTLATMPRWNPPANRPCAGIFDLMMTEDPAEAECAKEVCSECPAREECLRVATEQRLIGVWGGTTYKERQVLQVMAYGPCTLSVPAVVWDALSAEVKTPKASEIINDIRYLVQFDTGPQAYVWAGRASRAAAQGYMAAANRTGADRAERWGERISITPLNCADDEDCLDMEIEDHVELAFAS